MAARSLRIMWIQGIQPGMRVAHYGKHYSLWMSFVFILSYSGRFYIWRGTTIVISAIHTHDLNLPSLTRLYISMLAGVELDIGRKLSTPDKSSAIKWINCDITSKLRLQLSKMCSQLPKMCSLTMQSHLNRYYDYIPFEGVKFDFK